MQGIREMTDGWDQFVIEHVSGELSHLETYPSSLKKCIQLNFKMKYAKGLECDASIIHLSSRLICAHVC